MKTSAVMQKVLRILACSYLRSCSLEELAQRTDTAFKSFSDDHGLPNDEKHKQAVLLDALMLLDQQGLIFLDSDTDRSVITIKGLMQVNNTVLCN
ncbi:hypothetical protein [Flavobacterium notoginsengisoli]|uniref:hypothetical protein n=1 Tax=Flavobacterium notoginsengisoli TaxID=1478199 RepID=UPI003631C3BE